MDILITFSGKLKELMFESDLNAEALGKAIGVAPSVVRRWLMPNKDIYVGSLIKLAVYFKCSLDFICGRSNNDYEYNPKECPPFMEWLPNVIKASGKTTYKIFKDTKIKSSYFALWRKGSEPLLSSLGVLADYLDVSIDQIIGRDR